MDAIRDGDLQKTPEIQLDGDTKNYIELSIPKDVTCYNVTRNESVTNGTINIYGGDSFYLTAQMDADGQYDSGELFGSIKDDWKILTLTSGEGKEDIGVFESESTSADPVSFTVNWLEQTKISLLKKDRDTDEPVAGAVYGIYKDYKCRELLMEMPETDENGKTSSDYLDKGLKQVYVKERKAPEKYLLDSNVYPVDVETEKEIELTVYDVSENVEQENQPTEIHVTKVDAVTGEMLEGAVLQVADEKGNLVEEWTSTKEAHVIYGLPEGEYILHEKMAPYKEGYVSASDLTFQVSEESVTEVEMKDEYSKIDISVQDQPTGKALPGVTLQLLDEEGNVLKEWVTDGKPYRVEKLPVNEELILREAAVPKGYVIPKEAKFIVTDTQEIQSIEMKNARVSEPTSVSEKTSAPKTGDALHLLTLFLFAGLLSFIVLAVLVIRRRKRYGQEEE
ncbi:SpaA isopeptide-forming pilin-related protein [Schaedlerella sp.]|uniref:SpaA isopeptide-forming pilin-related protein n=1 Tax=Schaedlerella sp. TaxID=2676057 RepID=UPI00374A80B3